MNFISVLCIAALILWIFTVGLCVWCSIKFGQHWNELIFVKRRRLLTLALLIQYVVAFLTIPVAIFFTWSLGTNPNSKTTKALRVAHFSGYTFLMLPAFTMIQYLYLTRVWLLYYDMLLSKIQKNRQWRMIIDPKASNIIDRESKFALNNQNTLYKTKALLKIYGVAFFIEYIIIGYPAMFILHVTSNNGSIFDSNDQVLFFTTVYFTLMYFVRFCFGYYIWQKMNRLQMIDNFGIRKEIGYVMIQVTCGIIIFIFLILVNSVVGGVFDLIDDNLNQVINQLISAYYTVIFGCLNVYVMFVYPIRVYDKFSNDKNNKNADDDKENEKYIESISHWTQIMDTEIGYEEFMDYLAREFSTENLLFITEYIEVKKVLMDYFPHILDKLKQEYATECGFFVEFATLTSDEYKSLETTANSGFVGQLIGANNAADASNINQNEMQFIQSLIGKQLADQLFKLKTIAAPGVNRTRDEDDIGAVDIDYNCSKENIIAVGDCIVSAFSCIYSKYVDDYDASFMINISHRNRQSLLKLFDYKYYDKWRKNLKNNVNNTDGSIDKAMMKQVGRQRNQSIFAKLRNIASNVEKSDEEKSNENSNDRMNRIAMANYLLREHIANEPNDTRFTNKDEFDKRIEWLLKLLIENMENAVKEVSNLMQDSFFRFKRQKKHLFKYMIKSSTKPKS